MAGGGVAVGGVVGKLPCFSLKKKIVLFKKIPSSLNPSSPFPPQKSQSPFRFPSLLGFLVNVLPPVPLLLPSFSENSIPTMLCSQTSLSQPPPWQGGAVFGHASQTWLIRKPKNLAASSSQGGKNILPRETLTKMRVYNGVFK